MVYSLSRAFQTPQADIGIKSLQNTGRNLNQLELADHGRTTIPQRVSAEPSRLNVRATSGFLSGTRWGYGPCDFKNKLLPRPCASLRLARAVAVIHPNPVVCQFVLTGFEIHLLGRRH